MCVAADSHDAIAEFGMYPFASVRWAWDALWADVHRRAPWTPSELAFTGDVHARWADPRSVVNHVCGWPLAKYHAHEQRVVGAFSINIPEAEGHRYRSTLVSTRDASLEQLIADRVHVAANSADSLSGWVSLLAATGGAPWPGEVTFTGAHVESLRTLGRGEAVLACIDSWSLVLLEAEQPQLVDRLHRVGLGPLIPTPAVTVRHSVSDADAEALGDALRESLDDPASTELKSALRITGFDRTTFDEYSPVLDLAAW